MTSVARVSYDVSSNLLYDNINEMIYNINDRSSKDDYTIFENSASLSIIAEDEKCKKCKTHYSIITCYNCKKETCAQEQCCTLFPDKNGYISICKTCENEVISKIKPYEISKEIKYTKEYNKAVRDLNILKEAIKIIY
tara:strand:- start:188 stop:601 length:414 start_codon:yes stop_codon:yes gene_type:complete